MSENKNEAIASMKEADMVLCARAQGIKSLYVVQSTNGWMLEADLNWQKQRVTLVTQKGSVREWASIDRLIAHIKSAYAVRVPIAIEPIY